VAGGVHDPRVEDVDLAVVPLAAEETPQALPEAPELLGPEPQVGRPCLHPGGPPGNIHRVIGAAMGYPGDEQHRELVTGQVEAFPSAHKGQEALPGILPVLLDTGPYRHERLLHDHLPAGPAVLPGLAEHIHVFRKHGGVLVRRQQSEASPFRVFQRIDHVGDGIGDDVRFRFTRRSLGVRLEHRGLAVQVDLHVFPLKMRRVGAHETQLEPGQLDLDAQLGQHVVAADAQARLPGNGGQGGVRAVRVRHGARGEHHGVDLRPEDVRQPSADVILGGAYARIPPVPGKGDVVVASPGGLSRGRAGVPRHEALHRRGQVREPPEKVVHPLHLYQGLAVSRQGLARL